MKIQLPNITSGPWAVDIASDLPPAVIQDTEAGLGIAENISNPADTQAIAALPECLQALASILHEADNAEDSMEGLLDIRYHALSTARAALRAAGATITE